MPGVIWGSTHSALNQLTLSFFPGELSAVHFFDGRPLFFASGSSETLSPNGHGAFKV